MLFHVLFMSWDSLQSISPKDCFATNDSLLHKFIWDPSSRFRLAYKKLKLPVEEGGFNLLNLCRYYFAFQNVKYWNVTPEQETPEWALQEMAQLYLLCNWAASGFTHLSQPQVYFPVIEDTKFGWKMVGTQLAFNSFIHKDLHIWKKTEAGNRGVFWKHWMSNGLTIKVN